MSGHDPVRSTTTRARRRLILGLALVLACASGLLAPRHGTAQLISPGRLSELHADLSGLSNCTQCHQLGTPGISEQRCLDCHKPLAARIREGVGFHASDSTSTGCASCHTEHFGEDFELIRFDTLAFEHRTVGYELEGAHTEAECRSCHTPELVSDRGVLEFKGRTAALDRTFLGLPTECVSCHVGDDPHEGQFSDRACTSCHTEESWDEAPLFDHASTRYPLTGLHASVDCAACHVDEPTSSPGGGALPASFVRYAPVAFGTCTACHADEHEGAMEGACSTCHSTAGWDRIDRTDVEGRFAHETTGFQLVGAHDRAECVSCHDPTAPRPSELALEFLEATLSRAFPAPVAEECLSCHVDEHEGALLDAPGGAECTSCHGQEAWLPSHYGLVRHNDESRFALEGAHLTVACEACHRSELGELVMEPAFEQCVTCHEPDDPHAGQFADATCDSCHGVESFRIDPFDHSETQFPLDGGHENVECAACHPSEDGPAGAPFTRYTPLGIECVDCHGEEVP